MKLRLVRPSQGLIWLRNGALACWQQPFGFMGLMGLTTVAALTLMSLPLLGPLLVMGAMPMVWMSFMLATRRVLTSQRITPTVLIEPLRSPDCPKSNWLRLGGAYILAMILTMELADLLGPASDVLVQANEQAKDISEFLNNPDVQISLMWRWGLSLPVSLAFWHTAGLTMWAHVPVGKAIFFSAVASWRNLGAFVVYGLGWMGVAATIALLIRAVAAISPEPVLTDVLTAIVGMLTASAFYASLYFTVVDCFEPETTQSAPKQP